MKERERGRERERESERERERERVYLVHRSQGRQEALRPRCFLVNKYIARGVCVCVSVMLLGLGDVHY